MEKLKNALISFMRGRYGTDDFNKFLLWLYFSFAVLGLFVRRPLITGICFAVFVLLMFRMFSRNIWKRQQENAKFLKIKRKAVQRFNLERDKWKFRKTHVYKTCPNCKATVRLPKIKGKHVCCCPACKKNFDVVNR